MTILSESVLTDTILSLGIMICFYYGLVAFGCVWFFRHTLFEYLALKVKSIMDIWRKPDAAEGHQSVVEAVT